ncbi:MAG: mevalonate kinase [Myxococcales bacterium]|nr:mevalonate kinase [Myxococcales bacterium]
MPKHAATVARLGNGRASGKLILVGEHAVVYGAPALVAAIGRTLTATAERGSDGPSTLELDFELCLDSGDSAMSRAFSELLRAVSLDEPLGPICARVAGDLPSAAGLGFSAAAAVAVARALEDLRGVGNDDARERAVVLRAMAWERVFHGNPSGVDVSAAMHPGVLRFVRGSPPTVVVTAKPILVCVGISRQRSSTMTMVDAVRALRSSNPTRFDDELAAIAALVETAERALRSGALAELGALMSENHALLSAWQLSTMELDELCRTALANGALGAKLTGKGGGGAAVALAGAVLDREAETVACQIIAAWRALGYDGFTVPIGAAHAARAQGSS